MYNTSQLAILYPQAFHFYRY